MNYLTIASYVVTAFIAFSSAWSWQGSRADAELAAILADHSKAVANAAAQVDKIEAERDQLAAQKAQVRVEIVDRIKVEYRNRDREVIRYVEQNPDPECVLGDDWMRVTNHHARDPRLPEDSGARPDAYAESGAIRAVHTVPVIAANYKRYWELAEMHDALVDYVATQCRNPP